MVRKLVDVSTNIVLIGGVIITLLSPILITLAFLNMITSETLLSIVLLEVSVLWGAFMVIAAASLIAYFKDRSETW